MTITMNDSQLTTIQEIVDFLSTVTKIRYSRQSKVAKEEGCMWMQKRPSPLGKPGYFRVDSVHQGDNENGEKGLYHINLVDEITQTEYVCCVETLSAAHLVSVLEEILQKCPFVIRGFHSDNGSEYINRLVASLLERLMIEFTKSRSRQSTDNALVEGKDNIIRKLMGYGHIEQKHSSSTRCSLQII